ncbi:hypothetical protein ACO0OE_003948 [Hanseniaspora uvarum]
MTDSIADIISTVQEIVKNTTIFNEIIYKDDTQTYENLTVNATIDQYVENLKKLQGNEKVFKQYTISQKLENNEYKSIKEFYLDFVIVCFILINTLNKFSDAYYRIDKYFQVVSELLLRYLGTGLNNQIDEEQDIKDITVPKSLKKGLETQFDSIIQFYQAPVKKQAQVNIDIQSNAINKSTNTTYLNRLYNKESLFTSLMHKSILDKSEDGPIDENINYVENLPVDVSATIDAPKLGAVMPFTNRNIPDPTLPNTRILDKLMNPLWYKLPVETWIHSLVTDEDDEMEHVISIVTKNSSLVNCSQSNDFLNKKLQFLKQHNLNKVKENYDTDEIESITKNILEKKHAEIADKNEKINLKNLYNWSQEHYYNDEELQVLTTSKSMKEVQDLINKYLAQLSKLQQHRLKISKSIKAKPVEIELYAKIKRLLKFVLLNGDKEKVKNVKLEFTKNVPVLQANYTGTLPVKKISLTNSSSTGTSTYKSKYKKRR